MTQKTSDWTLKGNACPAWLDANDNAVGYYLVNYNHQLLTQLTAGDVEHRLNAAERVDFMGNAESLTNGGKLPASDALGLVKTFHNDPERYVVIAALNLAEEPRMHLVPEDLMPKYVQFLRDNFQARAHQVGWVPEPGESDDVHLLRPTLLRVVSTDAQDEQLATQARDLANKWFDNHNSVDPSIVAAVLRTAAFYGDKALMERFITEFKNTQDKQEQQRMVSAMQSFRDPAAIEAGMNAVLSGQISFMDGIALLFSGQGQASTRDLPFDFMKAHFDEIAAKRPTGGGFDAGSLFPYVGAAYCSTAEKDKLKDFFEPRIDKFTGGPRTLSQVLESISVCEALKTEEEPSVAAFLRSY